MSKNVLVVCVHPDDETLGAGGTLLRHKAEGDSIHWLIITKVSVKGGFTEERVASRQEEINKVAKLYDFDTVHELDFLTMHMDEYTVSERVSAISDVFAEVEPNIVYLPFKGDIHSDHRYAFEAAYSCTKSFRYPFVEKVYMMETLSETDYALSTKEDSFVPNVFVDISAYQKKKIEIMSIYDSEIGPPPFPRSLENMDALATYRGGSSYYRKAEAFMLLKERR